MYEEEVSSEFLKTGKSEGEGKKSTETRIISLCQKSNYKAWKEHLVLDSNDLPMNWKDLDFHGRFDSGE